MVAWSYSPAGERLRFQFQIKPAGGRWKNVPPSDLARVLSGAGAGMPEDPELEVKVLGFQYTDTPSAGSRWRVRAIDESGRRSGWCRPVPLENFNPDQVPRHLGVSIEG